MKTTDTITAIATAMTNSGIGIIRISGENSFHIINNIFKPFNSDKNILDVKSHTVHYGNIIDKIVQNELIKEIVIDEVLVIIMKAPNTYTREDVVEIDCHGGIVVVKKVMELILRNGARIAEPGEFTKRAFLNGRIDLSQAEAVIDVINAKNEMSLKSSMNQLKGSIRDQINILRKNIIYYIAFIEAALDDPEHIDVSGFGEELKPNVLKMIEDIHKLINTANDGKIIKEGIKTVILGKPNVGKSSLMNILAGDDKAIVTEIAGTTRDSLEENINISGISLNIIDTAGIRDTEDIVEKIGVDRSIKHVEDADLILYMIDVSRDLDKDDEKIINLIKNRKVIVLLNKIDLNNKVSKEYLEKRLDFPIIEVSAKINLGIDKFYDELKNMFLNGGISFNDEIFITNVRHLNALNETIHSLNQVIISIDQYMPEDFYSIDLMNAYEILGEIIGETVGEDLVNEIFASFCMGK